MFAVQTLYAPFLTGFIHYVMKMEEDFRKVRHNA